MFCDAGDAGVIYGSEVTGNGVHYQWQSSPDNITYTDIIDPNNGPAIYPNYDPPPGTSTVYYRRSVTTSVCNTPSVTRALAIQVFKTPVVAISDSVTLCAGSTTTLTASGGANYKWSPAQGLSSANVASPVASPDATTTYQVAVSNGGCSVNASVKVIVIPKPVVDAGPDQKIFRGETAQLNGKVTGNNVQYSWSPATYLDDPTILNPKATPPASITYTLTAITNYGCNIITDDVHLEVYEKVTVPTAFTPNNDGKNDTWEIVGLSTYPRSVTTIFNRDGMQLFRSIGYSKPWDGTFNGKPMPFGTYYYVIDLKDGFKLLSGWVALVK
nr:gliding motility-associated C-terminal domain-containing protein [Mucilaginibacter sp. dw_454]